MSKSYAQIDPKDNIVVAIDALPKNTFIDVNGTTFTLVEDIKQKHKFAIQDFAIGDEVFMNGTKQKFRGFRSYFT